MKKILPILAAAMLAAVSCGTVAGTSSSTTTKTAMVGAYTAFRPVQQVDVNLFKAATAKITDVTYTPKEVAAQIVSGTNYKFKCVAKKGSETYNAVVSIFQPLPGRGAPTVTGIERQ